MTLESWAAAGVSILAIIAWAYGIEWIDDAITRWRRR